MTCADAGPASAASGDGGSQARQGPPLRPPANSAPPSNIPSRSSSIQAVGGATPTSAGVLIAVLSFRKDTQMQPAKTKLPGLCTPLRKSSARTHTHTYMPQRHHRQISTAFTIVQEKSRNVRGWVHWKQKGSVFIGSFYQGEVMRAERFTLMSLWWTGKARQLAGLGKLCVAAQPAHVQPCCWLSLVMYTRSLQAKMANGSTWYALSQVYFSISLPRWPDPSVVYNIITQGKRPLSPPSSSGLAKRPLGGNYRSNLWLNDEEIWTCIPFFSCLCL